MKKILLSTVLSVSMLISSAQFVHKIKTDSLLITNDSCAAELIIENKTKDTLGFLYNKGKGRTEFRKVMIKLTDSTFLVGGDTIKILGGGSPGNFLQNQFGTSQPARTWVAGQIRTDSMIRVGQLTSDPTGANGMIYYNSVSTKFRVNKNAIGWVNALTSDDAESGVSYTSGNKLSFGGSSSTYGQGKLLRDTYLYTYDGSTQRKFVIFTGVAAVDGCVNTSFTRSGVIIGTPYAGGRFNGTIPSTGAVLKVGNIDHLTGADGSESNNQGSFTTVDVFNSGYGTNSKFKGMTIRLNGNNTSNNYNLVGLEVNTRHHYTNSVNVNGTAGNIALRLTANSVGAQGWLKGLTYAMYADSGRVYSRDSVMFGTTTPGAFFHVNGTSRFDLGSDATGDIFYRNSSGYFTRLPIGTNGQFLSVSGGLPFWTNGSGGSGSPGGTNGEVQFNNSGSFDGNSNFYWENTNYRLGIGTSSPQYKLDVNGDARISTLPFLADRDTILTYDPSTKQFKATRRIVQEDGSALSTQRGTINFNYGVKATENSGSARTDVDVELSNAESFVTSDISLTANTYSDATSVSLSAGTWLVSGSATVESPNNTAQRVTYKLWDGSIVYQAGEAACNSMGGSTKGYVSLPVSSIVVLSSTTTVKISIASTAASVIKATPGDNNSGTTNKATSIRAVRIK